MTGQVIAARLMTSQELAQVTHGVMVGLGLAHPGMYDTDYGASTIGTIVTGLLKSLRSIVNIIGGLAIAICGILLVFSSNPQTVEKAKSWLVRIVIGIILVNIADKVADGINNASKQ